VRIICTDTTSLNKSYRSTRGGTILCINVQSSGLLQIIRFDLQARLLLKLFTASSDLINHTRNQDTSCQCVCSHSQRCHSYTVTNIYWLYLYLSDFRTSWPPFKKKKTKGQQTVKCGGMDKVSKSAYTILQEMRHTFWWFNRTEIPLWVSMSQIICNHPQADSYWSSFTNIPVPPNKQQYTMFTQSWEFFP